MLGFAATRLHRVAIPASPMHTVGLDLVYAGNSIAKNHLFDAVLRWQNRKTEKLPLHYGDSRNVNVCIQLWQFF
jgi:hypothetical protein